jgi:hypothetical protein
MDGMNERALTPARAATTDGAAAPRAAARDLRLLVIVTALAIAFPLALGLLGGVVLAEPGGCGGG